MHVDLSFCSSLCSARRVPLRIGKHLQPPVSKTSALSRTQSSVPWRSSGPPHQLSS